MGFPPEIAAIIREMKDDMNGLYHLARDGMLRSFDGEGNVIDYRQLSHDQVMAYLRASPHEKQIKYEEWEHVDGTKVTDEKLLWFPDEKLKPVVFTSKSKAEETEKATESKEL